MESLARISSLLETARDLTIEAAQSAAGPERRKDHVAGPASFRETKRLLSSRFEKEVLDGLKKVTAMMARGTDCSPFFADVVKNVASPTFEIKKLVYLYLLRYAESEPDLALLSINTIQKALNDQNPLVRALAIRVMSGIRVPVIAQIVALGIKKCTGDMSAYVRKAAALAIPKCARLDPSTLPVLRENLKTLLADKSFFVVGAAMMAYLEVCPDDIEMIHPRYHGLLKMLIDMDEWGQLAVLRCLTVYARKCFPRRTVKVARNRPKKEKDEAAFYSDEESTKDEEGQGEYDEVQVIDLELQDLLDACLPLLRSRNSAVILAVARVYRHLAPPDQLDVVAGPLISLLRSSDDIRHVALVNIVSIALDHPSLFIPYFRTFLVTRTDPPNIWKLKIEMLTLIFPTADKIAKNLILNELEYCAQDYNKELVKACVRAIGRCAQSEKQNSTRCLRLLLRQIENKTDGTLIAECLTVLRHIIQQNPAAHSATVVKLAQALDKTSNPNARASIIWLVGEFAGDNNGDNIAADTLRILAKGFHDEAEAAKLQIVLLAAKVYAHHLNRNPPAPPQQTFNDGDGVSEDEEEEGDSHPITLLFQYIMLLARYDTSYDIRDRARMYKSLLSVPSATQLATLLLLAPKPVPHAPSPFEGIQEFTLGSTAMLLRSLGEADAMGLRGYEKLPDWVKPEDAPPKSVRVPEEKVAEVVEGSAAARIMKVVVGSGREKVEEKRDKKEAETLDQWLESEEEEEEESEEESDEEEEDEESEYETDSEEEEEEEEEESEDEMDERKGMLAGASSSSTSAVKK